jgi:hypothetical protein
MNKISEDIMSPDYSPALRLEPSWQLGFLQGAVRAFLKGYSTKERMESSYNLVEKWQKEQREKEDASFEETKRGIEVLTGKVEAAALVRARHAVPDLPE